MGLYVFIEDGTVTSDHLPEQLRRGSPWLISCEKHGGKFVFASACAQCRYRRDFGRPNENAKKLKVRCEYPRWVALVPFVPDTDLEEND